MNEKLLISIVVLSVISVGLAYLAGRFGRKNNDGYDERQLIERGRGAELAMMTVLVYLFLFYAGLEFEWLDVVSLDKIAVWGLVLVTTIFNAYVIFHDAYLRQGEEARSEIFRDIVVGLIWVAMARNFNGEWSWVQLWIAFDYLSEGLMLLTRALYHKFQEREEDDG